MKHRNPFVVYLLFCLIFLNSQTVSAHYKQFDFQSEQIISLERFWRTELYFGMNKPDGSSVSDEEWSKFLAVEVTPRFPKGFTVLEGFGQYQNENGNLVKEKSRVLILFYPKKEKRGNNEKIEQIRAAYKKAFQQESVLRLDFRQSVNVSF